MKTQTDNRVEGLLAQNEALLARVNAMELELHPIPPVKPKPQFFSGTVGFTVGLVRRPILSPTSCDKGTKHKFYKVQNDYLTWSGDYAFSKIQAFRKAQELALRDNLPVRICGWRDSLGELDHDEIVIVQTASARDFEHRAADIKEWIFDGKVASIFIETTRDLTAEYETFSPPAPEPLIDLPLYCENDFASRAKYLERVI
jgi:hypothetical protein